MAKKKYEFKPDKNAIGFFHKLYLTKKQRLSILKWSLYALVLLVLSLLLSRMLTGKIGQLLTAIRKVREGSYNHRAEIKGHDEVAQIGREFNSLAEPG